MTETHPNHVHPRSKRTAPAKPYRRLFKPVVPVVDSKARDASTYRGARLNAVRGERKSIALKKERLDRGIGRRELDAERARIRREA